MTPMNASISSTSIYILVYIHIPSHEHSSLVILSGKKWATFQSKLFKYCTLNFFNVRHLKVYPF